MIVSELVDWRESVGCFFVFLCLVSSGTFFMGTDVISVGLLTYHTYLVFLPVLFPSSLYLLVVLDSHEFAVFTLVRLAIVIRCLLGGLL